MSVTKEMFSSIKSEVAKYQEAHFGIKNGSDFPAFAETIADTKEFADLVSNASMLGLLVMLTLSGDKDKPESEAMSKQSMGDILKGKGPMAGQIADVLYIGYRLGVAASETKNLEQLAKL